MMKSQVSLPGYHTHEVDTLELSPHQAHRHVVMGDGNCVGKTDTGDPCPCLAFVGEPDPTNPGSPDNQCQNPDCGHDYLLHMSVDSLLKKQ